MAQMDAKSPPGSRQTPTEVERYQQAVAAGRIGVYERYHEILDRAADEAGLTYGALAVDIWSRTGELGLILAQRGCHIVALDPSAEMLSAALGKARSAGVADRLRPLCVGEPFTSIPLDSGSASAVVSAFAFHKLDDAAKPEAVRELARVVRPGGRVVLADTMFPDESDKAEALQMYGEWLEDRAFASLAHLAVFFAEAGLNFRCEQMTVVNWVVWGQKG